MATRASANGDHAEAAAKDDPADTGEEFDRFEQLARSLLNVPKDEINARLPDAPSEAAVKAQT